MTWPDDTYDEYRKSSDFFKKHLSPGLNLPSIQAIKQAMSKDLEVVINYKCLFKFQIVDISSIGPHYAPTLLKWIVKLDARKDDVLKMGYSMHFYRKWRFFLCSCVPCFADKYCDVTHFVLRKHET
jgi:cyclopropane-fatty-acyl-phospholipid synthase